MAETTGEGPAEEWEGGQDEVGSEEDVLLEGGGSGMKSREWVGKPRGQGGCVECSLEGVKGGNKDPPSKAVARCDGD